ncbi:peptidase M24, structural domain-containing protein [Parasitella parasitica]|nr:peptidase M24, structural domain-containing protein [Parasitella parasitica]
MDSKIFPAKEKINTREHYLKIKQYLPVKTAGSIIYHRGGTTHTRDDTDVELDFRQESNFAYLSGVEAAGFHIVIVLETDTIYLVRPDIPKIEQLWKGIPEPDTALMKKYNVDHILLDTQLKQFLQHLEPTVILTLDITNIDYDRYIPMGFEKRIDRNHLKAAIHEARLTKFPWEISLLRYAAQMSSHAHMNLMSYCGDKFRHNQRINEAELEARFRWICSKNGLLRQCYIPIIASGSRAAVLHYTQNDKLIPNDQHALVLVDAGGEYRCYGSDVTRTFPVSTRFSDEAKTIYDIVLKAQNAVLARLKPGVFWKDMHDLVVHILCHELVKIGVLIGEEEELLQLQVYRAFYFHGTGHSVGLDCHDVGGKYINIMENTRKGIPLHLLQKPLDENMVLTVEPGLYFNDVSIDVWTKNPGYKHYFDMDKINQYRVIGGVRIEDTVLITCDGIENFTVAPKQTQDIEALMH